LVGSFQSATAQAANAPKVNLAHNPKAYAKLLVANPRQFACLDLLWTSESHWNASAKSPTSTAFGIPQFLNATWEHYHYPVRPKDPLMQINAGLRYITVRYGTPCKAWTFWKNQQRRGNAWY